MLPYDSERFRKRAAKCRCIAELMADQSSRDGMLQLAADYEKLAVQIDRIIEADLASPASAIHH